MYVCIFEDNHFINFLPLVYLRPVYDLRCGVLSLREKIESLFPRTTFVLHVRNGLAEYVREENPGTMVNTFPEDDCWFINGRILADRHHAKFFRKHTLHSKVFLKEDGIAAVYVDRKDVRHSIDQVSGRLIDRNMFEHFPSEDFPGEMVKYPWELIQRTSDEIEKDFRRATNKNRKIKVPAGVHLVNKKNIILGKGALIKPGAVLDAEKGPIILGNNVTVMSNAVIEGPAFIGDESVIKIGSKIYHGTSIGKYCKVGGEIDASIIQSFSNKQHDGFLGHSYLGSWVNIGADTNTSDLKNTYGTVKVYVGGSLIDTGLQFMGMMMGDHSKSGINVMFDTGTVIGISCNVYGSGLPPKALPSFSWGGEKSYSPFALGKSLETARKVMERRTVFLSGTYEKLMKDVFAKTEEERRKLGII